MYMTVNEEIIRIQDRMNYLTLDSRLCFEKHVALLTPKIEGLAIFLGRLLHNIRGPGSKVRVLYMGVVRSMYGIPIWFNNLRGRGCDRVILRCT